MSDVLEEYRLWLRAMAESDEPMGQAYRNALSRLDELLPPTGKVTCPDCKEAVSLEQSSLEEVYRKYFRPDLQVIQQRQGDLRQPSPLRTVPSVTTYSAYEDPV